MNNGNIPKYTPKQGGSEIYLQRSKVASDRQIQINNGKISSQKGGSTTKTVRTHSFGRGREAESSNLVKSEALIIKLNNEKGGDGNVAPLFGGGRRKRRRTKKRKKHIMYRRRRKKRRTKRRRKRTKRGGAICAGSCLLPLLLL